MSIEWSPLVIGAVAAAALAFISSASNQFRNWKKDKALAAERLEDRKEAAEDRRAALSVAATTSERARQAAVAVETVRVDLAVQNDGVSRKLDSLHEQGAEIHALVNSQLSEAVARVKEALETVAAMKAKIEELTGLMLRLAPDDPRVRGLLAEQAKDAPKDAPPT